MMMTLQPFFIKCSAQILLISPAPITRAENPAREPPANSLALFTATLDMETGDELISVLLLTAAAHLKV